MSVPLTINGSIFNYPQNFDTNWGVDATAWAQAVTSGMLQKAGGSFPLTADVNFGSSFGLIAPYFTSHATNPSTAGTLRLASADPGVAFRNNTNSGNLILTTDASDNLIYNGHIISPSSAGTVTSITGTANQVIASTPTGNVTLSLPQSIATTSSPTFLSETLSHSGLILQDTEGTPKTITLSAPTTLSSTWSLALPISAGLTGQVLSTDGAGNTSWINAAGGGTINSGTANQIAYYATTGTTLSGSSQVSFVPGQLSIVAPTGPTGMLIQAQDASTAQLDLAILGAFFSIANITPVGTLRFTDNTNTRNFLVYTASGGGLLTSAVPLAMGANKITGLANGTASTDAAAFGQIPVLRVPTIQRLTSTSGTYTTPTSPSPLYLKVKMVGAGGGGGGGGSGATNGTNGTATTFGTAFLSAGLGAAGGHDADGGSGGSNTTGGTTVLNIQGGAGQGSCLNPNSSTGLVGGIGGGNPWAAGARASRYNDGSGASGQNNTGEGGQGGGTTGSDFTGSGGGAGGYLEVIISSPAATYSYTVGTGGNGGSGGSSGGGGGNGGSGLIVVEEHYQ